METGLVVLKAEDYGVTDTNKAAQIEAMFAPMLAKMKELEAEKNRIIKLPMDSGKVREAKALRMKYVKVRTGTAGIHKGLKAEYLAGGRMVDGWKNTQLAASQGAEKELKDVEDHFLNLETKRIEALQVERSGLLTPYEVAIIPGNLGSMEDSVWDAFLIGNKTTYDNRIEAEKKAEHDRIEAEKKEQQRISDERQIEDEYQRRKDELITSGFSWDGNYFWVSDFKRLDIDTVRKFNPTDFDTVLNAGKMELGAIKYREDQARENERKEADRLKKEALERERLEKIEAQKRAKDEKARKENEIKERQEREMIEAKRRQKEVEEKRIQDEKIQADKYKQDTILAEEREAKRKIEIELKARKDAETAQRKAEKEAAQKELNKGDADKVLDLVADLNRLKSKYSFESEANTEMYSDVCKLIDKVTAHIQSKQGLFS